jgi:hypothetical protein
LHLYAQGDRVCGSDGTRQVGHDAVANSNARSEPPVFLFDGLAVFITLRIRVFV